ncbi:MAG TPA: site-2 protease family protein [Planctomycetota bacterium]|nr:site-2 protease family protein [Planctomycetota bacterium]
MDWVQIALTAAAFLASLSFHEAAHAWTAWRLGDYTGKAMGRVSLNPIRHIDPFGTILLPALLWWSTGGRVVFGYAKPVPYNPYVLKNPSLGSAAIAAAGPGSNLLLATTCAILLGLASPGGVLGGSLGHHFLLLSISVNLYLALFNLLPLPPLDGGTVLAGLLGRDAQAAFARIETFGFIILIVLMQTGFLGRVLHPAFDFLWEHLLALAGSIRG